MLVKAIYLGDGKSLVKQRVGVAEHEVEFMPEGVTPGAEFDYEMYVAGRDELTVEQEAIYKASLCPQTKEEEATWEARQEELRLAQEAKQKQIKDAELARIKEIEEAKAAEAKRIEDARIAREAEAKRIEDERIAREAQEAADRQAAWEAAQQNNENNEQSNEGEE